MKFTKLYAAAFAAMTIASCSNEQEIMSPTGPELNPGEALVIFNFNNNLTRLTAEEEDRIHKVVYAVYSEESGDSIPVERITSTTPGTIQFRVSAVDVENNKGANMQILLAANGTADVLAETLADAEMLVENKDLNNLSTGLPASIKGSFSLTAGTVTVKTEGSNGLKRVVSRLFVEKDAASTGTIKGATINITGLANSAYLFSAGYPNANGSANFTVDSEDLQVVGYVYASAADAKMTIMLNGEQQTVTLPELGKNRDYKLKVKTSDSSSDGSTGSWTVTIEPWDENGGDINIDMNNKLEINTDYVNGNITADSNGLIVEVSAASVVIPFSDLFKEKLTPSEIVSVGDAATRSALGAESSDGVLTVGTSDTGFTLTALNTEVGNDKSYKVIFKAENDNAETKVYAIRVTVVGYPENFSMMMNGIEVMTVGAGLTPVATVKAINAMPGATYVEKTKNYINQNFAVNEPKVMGSPAAVGQLAPKCPEGFTIPTKVKLEAIFANGLGEPDAYDSPNKKFNISAGQTITLGTSALEHIGTPYKYFILTDSDGHKMFIPGGDSRATSKAYNMTAKWGSGENYVRFIVFKNQVEYKRTIPNDAQNYIRCVRK